MACRWCRVGALRGPERHPRTDVLAVLAYWGIGMPVGRVVGAGLERGSARHVLGLTAGLLVAAILMARRFLRSSQPQRLANTFSHRPMTDGA